MTFKQRKRRNQMKKVVFVVISEMNDSSVPNR